MEEGVISRLSKLDGRWFLGGSHLTLLIVSIFYFNLARSPFQIVTAYAAAILVELALHRITGKTKHRSAWDVIFSAATEAAGLLILVKLPNPYAYAMMSAVAVASKYFLRIDEKRHAFNPTNFAIVAALIFTPNELIEIRPDEFNLTYYAIGHVIFFGVFAVILGKTWRVAAAYFCSILLFSGLFSIVERESWIYFLGPEIGAIGMVFMFLMITDPKTTPKSNEMQIVYGVSVGLFLYILRYFEVFYAHFLALFIVTLLRAVFLLLEADAWKIPLLNRQSLEPQK